VTLTMSSATTYKATGVTMAADDIVILFPAAADSAMALAMDTGEGMYVSAINGTSGFTASHSVDFGNLVFSYIISSKYP